MPIETAEPDVPEMLADRIARLERENGELRAARDAGRAALKASESRLHSILESATDYAIITQDPEGRITGWSRGARQVLGWDEVEVLGQDCGVIFTPEDRDVGVPYEEMAKARRDGRAEDERWHVRRDGSRFWANGVLMVMHDGAGQGFVKILRDGTSHREAEQELRRQLDLTRTITEHAAEALFLVDMHGLITVANPAAEALFGFSQDRMIGQSLHDLLHHHHADGRPYPAADCPLVGALDSGEVLKDHQDVFFARDGAAIDVVCSSAPILDSAGRVTGAVLVAHDVTQRKRAEAALRDNEARQRDILESISDAFYALDEQMRFIYVNRRAAALWQRLPEELLGRAFTEAFPQVLGSPQWRSHQEVAASRSPVTLEVLSPIVRKWLRASIYPAPNGGITVYFRDISASKRAEEALRESEANFRFMADAIPQLAWMTDETGGIVWYNQRWFDFTGATFDDMKGWGWASVHHPDHVDRVKDHFLRCIAAGEPWEDTFPLRARDGQFRWFLSRALPVRDAKGRTLRWFGTNTDITAEREAQAHQRLLMGELTHRVKNTLAIVQAIASQTMRNAPSLPEAREAFGARLAALAQAHDILMQESWAAASIRTIVSGAVRLHDDGSARRFRIEGPDLPLGPKPALALAMILHELSTNATKYGSLSVPSGHVDVGWAVAEAPGGPRLRLWWRESGGPPATPPSRRGFGSRLIERGIASAGDGKVDLAYEPSGFACILEARLAAVQEAEGPDAP